MTMDSELSLTEGHKRFIEAANEAAAIILSRDDADETSLAEGYIYLAGMWIFHLERVFKSYDVNHPCFVRDMDGFRTWGLPAPDHHYYSAQIDGEGVYKISGNRGSVVDLCFEVLSGLVGDDAEVGERVSATEMKDIICDEEGYFEIIVGGLKQDQNWLALSKSARCIFVRQTVDDWKNVRPYPLLIQRIDIDSARLPEKRYQRGAVAKLFDQAARNMLNQVRFLNEFCLQWQRILPINELPQPTVGPADAGYFPGQFNTKCQFILEKRQALVITMPTSSAKYESLSLAHPQWFNSINPRLVQSSINRNQAVLSQDGLYRYVISPVDPGVPNWLDTSGLLTGFLFIRYQRADPTQAPMKPSIKLVLLEDLKLGSPGDHTDTNQGSILEATNQRAHGMDRRYF